MFEIGHQETTEPPRRGGCFVSSRKFALPPDSQTSGFGMTLCWEVVYDETATIQRGVRTTGADTGRQITRLSLPTIIARRRLSLFIHRQGTAPVTRLRCPTNWRCGEVVCGRTQSHREIVVIAEPVR